ncbi:MAG: hypothetical protein HFJ75_07530 [Eggerthellaceae bacterium]|nr:hypothetical protein [Eggerthellaceae bacterium]
MPNNGNGEVSGDDLIGTSDNSGYCRHDETAQDAEGVPGAHGQDLQPQCLDAGFGELPEEIARQIASDTESQIESRLEAHWAIASSGPIPDPATLKAYPPDVQKKIIDWQDRQVKAIFDDASRREDYIASKVARLDVLKQWLSFFFNILLVGGVIVAFVITGDATVFWSYTLLGATVVGQVVINVNKNKNRNQSHDDQSRFDLDL